MVEAKASEIVFEQLLSGQLTLNTLDDFRKAMRSHPDNPWLHRLLADLHKTNKSFIEADKTYKKAYQLFMEEGSSLQAIAARLRGWTIIRPTPFDLRDLHLRLRRRSSHSSAIAECFAKMSYQELVDVLRKTSLISYPAQQIISKAGEVEDALYFVVHGRLSSTDPDDNGPQGETARVLKENDFFGDNQPWSEEKSLSTLIKSRTKVELLKISKPDLLTLCGEHPDLEIGLKSLLEDQAETDEEKPSKFLRKTSRRKLVINLHLEIFEREPGKHPLGVKCFTSDISLGGVCVIVDPRYRDLPIEDLVNRECRLRISLPDESISLAILGRLAWYKETEFEETGTYAIGIQFKEMPPRLRGLLIVFANAVGSMSRQFGEEEEE